MADTFVKVMSWSSQMERDLSKPTLVVQAHEALRFGSALAACRPSAAECDLRATGVTHGRALTEIPTSPKHLSLTPNG